MTFPLISICLVKSDRQSGIHLGHKRGQKEPIHNYLSERALTLSMIFEEKPTNPLNLQYLICRYLTFKSLKSNLRKHFVRLELLHFASHWIWCQKDEQKAGNLVDVDKQCNAIAQNVQRSDI